MRKNIEKFLTTISLLFATIFLLWYMLPIVRYIFSGTIANYIQGACIGMYIFIMLILNKKRGIKMPMFIVFMIINVIFYVCNLIFRGDSGNVENFIKMGTIFFIVIVFFKFYYNRNDKKSLKYIYILIIISFLLTLIPTLIEVFKDSNSLRMKSYFAIYKLDSQIIKNSYNIGDYSFIFGSLFIIPILFYEYKKKKNKLILLIIISVLLMIYKASFSIAIILSVFCLLLCVYNFSSFNSKKTKAILITLAVCIPFIFVLFPTILLKISTFIGNDFVKARTIEIVNILEFNYSSLGDILGRAKLYLMSIKTFFAHPLFGIGGYYYDYTVNIGYHSQFFDDIARYGIFYLLNTIFLIVEYKKFLINKLCHDTQIKKIVKIEMFMYIILLLINPIYDCSWISINFFVLLPCYLYLNGDGNDGNEKIIKNHASSNSKKE